MALPTSGSLSIKGAAGAGRSISQEVDGNETGNKSLTTLSTTAGKTASHSMLEFYGYSSCTAAPNTPTAASASVVADDVTISWTPHSLGDRATQYRIERNPQSTGVWSFVANVGYGVGDSYTDNNLASDQYQYRVRAENNCGNSAYITTNSVIVP